MDNSANKVMLPKILRKSFEYNVGEEKLSYVTSNLTFSKGNEVFHDSLGTSYIREYSYP